MREEPSEQPRCQGLSSFFQVNTASTDGYVGESAANLACRVHHAFLDCDMSGGRLFLGSQNRQRRRRKALHHHCHSWVSPRTKRTSWFRLNVGFQRIHENRWSANDEFPHLFTHLSFFVQAANLSRNSLFGATAIDHHQSSSSSHNDTQSQPLVGQ